jgi:hypothetical protein
VERHFVYVLRAHAYLVVPGSEVQLGEELGTMELVEELVNHRDRESILDGEHVQRPVVDAEVPRTVGLLDEEDGRREQRVAAADNPLLQRGGTLPLQLVLVCCRVPVRPDGDRLGVGLKNDAVVMRSLGWQTDGVCEESPKREQRRACPPGPGDGAPLVLEGHAPAAEVPNNGPQLAEPPGVENDVVPSQWHDVEVGRERIAIDE